MGGGATMVQWINSKVASSDRPSSTKLKYQFYLNIL